MIPEPSVGVAVSELKITWLMAVLTTLRDATDSPPPSVTLAGAWAACWRRQLINPSSPLNQSATEVTRL